MLDRFIFLRDATGKAKRSCRESRTSSVPAAAARAALSGEFAIAVAMSMSTCAVRVVPQWFHLCGQQGRSGG